MTEPRRTYYIGWKKLDTDGYMLPAHLCDFLEQQNSSMITEVQSVVSGGLRGSRMDCKGAGGDSQG